MPGVRLMEGHGLNSLSGNCWTKHKAELGQQPSLWAGTILAQWPLSVLIFTITVQEGSDRFRGAPGETASYDSFESRFQKGKKKEELNNCWVQSTRQKLFTTVYGYYRQLGYNHGTYQNCNSRLPQPHRKWWTCLAVVGLSVLTQFLGLLVLSMSPLYFTSSHALWEYQKLVFLHKSYNPALCSWSRLECEFLLLLPDHQTGMCPLFCS